MTFEERLQRVQHYQNLVKQGVPPMQAFSQAFPQGLPNSEKNQAKAQEKAGQQQMLGQLAGLGAGTAAGYGVKEGISALFGTGSSPAAGGATSGSGLSAPTVVSSGKVASGAVGGGSGGGGAGIVESGGMFSNPWVSGGLGAAGMVLGASGMMDAYEDQDPVMGGLSGAGFGAGAGALGSALGLSWIPGIGWLAAGGALLGALTGAMGHESTRDGAKRHTKTLQGMGKDDPTWQNYVQGMRAQYNEAPPDPSKPFAGKYGTWDEYKAAGLEASDLTGVHGNLETFGPQWAHLSQDQRQQVTQALIDADLYHSRKGEVNVSDKQRAKQIFESIKPSFGQSVTNKVGR